MALFLFLRNIYSSSEITSRWPFRLYFCTFLHPLHILHLSNSLSTSQWTELEISISWWCGDFCSTRLFLQTEPCPAICRTTARGIKACCTATAFHWLQKLDHRGIAGSCKTFLTLVFNVWMKCQLVVSSDCSCLLPDAVACFQCIMFDLWTSRNVLWIFYELTCFSVKCQLANLQFQSICNTGWNSTRSFRKYTFV